MPDTVTSEFETVPAPPHANHVDDAPPAQRPVVVQFQQTPTPPGPGGPRAPRGIQWIPLAEEGDYAEHQFKARLRYPDSLNQEFGSGDFDRLREALKRVVLEHNGWVDPDSETDPPQVLPPVDKPCKTTLGMKHALVKADLKLETDLKQAKLTEVEKTTLKADHAKAVTQIHADALAERDGLTEPCCFWDNVSQEEVILMLRAVNVHKGKILNGLLETKPD